MKQTISEKILSEHSGKLARAGDIVIAQVDFCYGQDVTSAMIIESFRKIGAEDIYSRNKFCMVMDHSAPSTGIAVSEAHGKMRAFGKEFAVKIHDIGDGISHLVVPESGYVTAGDLVLGADSHACTIGALGVLATGVGATDIAITLASGKNWFRVPETTKIVINGKLPKGVFSKDVMLHIAKDVGIDGATYKSIEFSGEVIDDLSMDARFTLSNMVVEIGAKCGIIHLDKKTLFWLKKHGAKDARAQEADQDARYSEIREYDMSGLTPQVAIPHTVDNVCDIDEVLGTTINEVCIGTCSNGRLEDMEIASSILKGKRVAAGTKLIITPASRLQYLVALKKGYIGILLEAGAVINNPGYGPSVGTHQGIPADGDNVFSTSNRNFKGKMGNPAANIYLGSPATAAATAISGKIADPREYKRKL